MINDINIIQKLLSKAARNIARRRDRETSRGRIGESFLREEFMVGKENERKETKFDTSYRRKNGEFFSH